MPQLFQVLRCYKCLAFQVHQTKKSNKWECKICGEKQSMKRHYGLGNAQECRIHVQKLNKLRGEKGESKIDRSSTESEDDNNDEITLSPDLNLVNNVHLRKQSKWSDFVSDTKECTEISETMYLDDTEVVLEIPKPRSNKHNKHNYKKRTSVASKNDHIEDTVFNIELKQSLMDSCSYGETSVANMKIKTEKGAKILCESFKNSSKKFIPPTTKQNSQQAQYSEDFPNIEPHNEECTKIASKDITINKNSKWAQYIVDNDEFGVVSQENNILDPTNMTIEKSQNLQSMFSLCHENDIDNILDI